MYLLEKMHRVLLQSTIIHLWVPARRFDNTGLLNGYSVQKDGTIIVVDDRIVIAATMKLLGQSHSQQSRRGLFRAMAKAYGQSAHFSFEE